MPMENEGPRPPLKGQCRETAAEQMSRQQKEYEDRSGPPRDEVKQAATHNETHPKLKQQLDKRRSAIEFIDRPETQVCRCHVENRGQRWSSDSDRRPRNTNRVTKRRDREPCTISNCLTKPGFMKSIVSLPEYVIDKLVRWYRPAYRTAWYQYTNTTMFDKQVGTDTTLFDKQVGTDTLFDEESPDVPNPKPSKDYSMSNHSFDSSEHQPME